MAKRDNPTAARALADWARHGFTNDAAHRLSDTYKVSTRTLWRWKDALDNDNELSQLFRDRMNDALDQDWAAELDGALREIITRIRELVADENDLAKVTAAFEKLSEVLITREVFGVAVDGQQDPTTTEARRDPPPHRSLTTN